jgi:hypothetical protein
MTDSPTYDAHDAHHPVQWTPDHVAKHKDASAFTDAKHKDASAFTDAKHKDADAKHNDAKAKTDEGRKAKGWAGLPIM